jgi:hypothetical protein
LGGPARPTKSDKSPPLSRGTSDRWGARALIRRSRVPRPLPGALRVRGKADLPELGPPSVLVPGADCRPPGPCGSEPAPSGQQHVQYGRAGGRGDNCCQGRDARRLPLPLVLHEGERVGVRGRCSSDVVVHRPLTLTLSPLNRGERGSVASGARCRGRPPQFTPASEPGRPGQFV